MEESEAAALEFQFGVDPVEGEVLMAGGDAAQQVGVAVVVAEDGVDGAGKALGKGLERERRAEIPEEEEPLGSLATGGPERGFKVVEAVVDVTEDGSGSITVVDIKGYVRVGNDGPGDITVRDIGGDFTVDHGGSCRITHTNVAGRVEIPSD